MRLSTPNFLKPPIRYTAVCILGAGLAALTAAGLAQIDASAAASFSATPAATAPSFDVATIKQHPTGPLSIVGVMNTPDGATGTATLQMLVQQTYGLRTADQVLGGPDWTKTEWFDFQAKLGEADVTAMQKMSPAESTLHRQQMMQTLLADRFQLKVHSGSKQAPIYELVVAKGGPKLRDAATDSDDHLRKGPDGKPLPGFAQFLKDRTTAQGYSMGALANLLSQSFAGLGRPVLDKTGLTGSYDFSLDWSPPMKAVLPGAVANPASDQESASIFTALGDLGLKLQPATGPIDTIVIDHVERPSEN